MSAMTKFLTEYPVLSNAIKKALKIQKSAIDLKGVKDAVESCSVIVDKSGNLDMTISSNPVGVSSNLMEARDQLQPAVELCKEALLAYNAMSQSVDKIESCFGLDHTILGTIEHEIVSFINSYTGKAADFTKECAQYVTDANKQEELAYNFKKAFLNMDSYWKAHGLELSYALQALVDAEQFEMPS
jgi:hypothetical protein